MTRQTARQLASVLGVSFLLSAGLLLAAIGLLLGLHDWVYSVHSSFWELSPETFDASIYNQLGLLKTLSIVLFLIPWVALRIVAPSLPDAESR